MAYWLMKSEPDVFSYADLEAKTAKGEVEEWHGVRNYLARNNMREMKKGDLAFFYHSNIGREIVGIARIANESHPDSTAEPNTKGQIVWDCVDLEAVKPFPRAVTLAEIKGTEQLSEIELVKYSRLSVSRVSEYEWELLCKMGGL
ncbi:EVE domain-containing protein [Devosia sp. MC532]|uniref:EVE domain-containing protein n=1 Tax=Devosia sp. MC532 TaxID=2799788 RepID=UPI0018F57358|nr:EVE domain-containing protein [Devosia sp. MC532]MBJ7577159.1 EVE domain-containing protein [Devosia sp. MC532]